MTVNDMTKEEFDTYYNSLCEIANELLPYYDIDKVKTYAVYVWSKEDENCEQDGLFDIYSDSIDMWDEEHEIIEETIPIIKKIQKKLKEFDKYLGEKE